MPIVRFFYNSNFCFKSICLLQFILATNLNGIIETSLLSNGGDELTIINRLHGNNGGHAHHHTNKSTNSLVANVNVIKCKTHLNCSVKTLTLDSYCSESEEICYSWFEYVLNYDAKLSTLPYKGPTLFTILILLILIIVLLFAFYCMLIMLCYCCKCGLFKKPNIVLINEIMSSNSDSASAADMITPKSSSTSSSLSSSDISYSSPTNRHHHHHPIVYNHRLNNHKKSGQYSASNINSKRTGAGSGAGNSSARIGGGKTRGVNTSLNVSGHHRHGARLYADPDCYIDYDNDSPFLVPEQRMSKSRVQQSQTPSRRHQQTSSHQRQNSTRHNTERADEHSLFVNARGSAASSSNVNERQLSMTNQRNENLISNTRNLIDEELTVTTNSEANSEQQDQQQQQQLTDSEPSTSRSSPSLDFELTNAQSVISINNPLNSVGGGGGSGVADSMKMPSAPSYYLDEKPPSYDDIINNKK